MPPGRGYAWSKPPIDGESLIGFVSRNLAWHGIDDMRVGLLPLATVPTDPGRLAVTPHVPAMLAELFRAEPDAIARMACPDVANDDDTRNRRIRFFGEPIRQQFFTSARRVSPRSLTRSPHHRGMWHLRPLAFCPESLEPLITRCPDPACGQGLGWNATSAPFECEHCGTDLRQHPQEPLPCADPEALTFVTGLVNPLPSEKHRAVEAVPAGLASCTPSEIFEFAVVLGGVLDGELNPNKTTWRRFRTDSDFDRLTSDRLARAGRILLEWPRGFHDLADGYRAQAATRTIASYGKLKELGILLPLSHDPSLPSRPRALVRAEIEANMAASEVVLRHGPSRASKDWITTTEASRLSGFHGQTLQRISERGDTSTVRASGPSPIMFKASEISAIVEEHRSALAASVAERLIGVVPPDLEALVSAGFVAWLGGPAAEVHPTQRRVTGASVAAFDAALTQAAGVERDVGPEWVRLDRAIAASNLRPEALPVLIREVLNHGIAARRSPEGDGDPLFRRIHIHHTWTARVPGATSPDASAWEPHCPCGAQTAARFLNMPYGPVVDLVSGGWIPAAKLDGHELRIGFRDLKAFHERYMLTGEITRLSGFGCRKCRIAMARLGVTPIALVGRTRFSLWDRAAVMGALARR